ncbi:MAG TPA: hypothetical protein VJ482_11000 [Acidimicrobiia bacterium]|nr:hypothetical protein [Acidimicrobiia bacterium]
MRSRMMSRRMMMHHQMMRHGHAVYGPCGPGAGRQREGWSDEDRLAMLEEYQRDLEQEVEDVAEWIKRLKEEKAKA